MRPSPRVIRSPRFSQLAGIPDFLPIRLVGRAIKVSTAFLDGTARPGYFLHPQISNSKIQEMYYMACYDLDRFRRFVLESSFLKRFELIPEQVNAIRQDDEALYRFAIQWLEYGLLSGQSLKVKTEVMTAKKQELGIE